MAFLYASVGHGGASGYLALMTLFGFSVVFMKPAALLLNLFVSFTSFLMFLKGRHFRWRLFWPFALASIPFSYWGGVLTVDTGIYKKLLGILLLFPVVRFLLVSGESNHPNKKPVLLISVFFGILIGFLSGLIGIGGGILLSPLLLILNWADQKQAAAVSALFIFVNSASGLAGQVASGVQFERQMVYFASVAFVGGLFGAWMGSLKFDQRILKYILAIVLLLASLKLLFT